MLGIFVLTILLGFPICFTLMAMGVAFGFYAYYDAERMRSIFDNQIFDLLVNQTYSVMANDVLTAVPLFLFMGYIVERANIVDRLFFSLQIAARRMPGSMAIAALATCALFATATGIIGAVVTLMGLLAFPAMLKARYDTSFSAGVICAGGCLGILIPPSIMLIVYAATSNVSVVRLYAGAIFPGFMLAGLYIVYVIGRAMLNPKLAPKPRAEEVGDLSTGQVTAMMLTSFFPLAFLILSVLGAILFGLATPSEAASMGALGGLILAACYRLGAIFRGDVEPPAWASRRLDHGVFALLPALALGGLLSLSTLAVIAYVGLFFGYAADIKGWSGGLWLGLGVAYALLVHFARPLVAGAFSALMEPGPVRNVLLGVCAISGAIAFVLLLYDAFTWMSADDPGAVRPAGEEGEGGSGGSLRTWTGFVCGLVLLVYTLGAFFYRMVPRSAGDRPERRFLAFIGAGAVAGTGLALAYMLVVAPLYGKEASLRALDAGFLAMLLIAATVLGTRWDPPEGVRLPDGAHLRDGVLAVRGLVDLLFGVLLPRRARAHPGLRARARALGADLPDHGPAHHLPARLAARMERDHHHLRADLPADAGALRHRPPVLRHPGGAQPPDLVPDPADGHGRLLSQGRRASPHPAHRDLQGGAAVPVDGDPRHGAAVRVPADRAVAARADLPVIDR